MQKYEMLMLLVNDLEDEAKEAEIKKYADIVAAMGGNVEATDKWGTKKLAYAIDDKTEAYYVLLTFRAPGAVVAELDRVAGISSNILRRVITKVEE